MLVEAQQKGLFERPPKPKAVKAADTIKLKKEDVDLIVRGYCYSAMTSAHLIKGA